MTSVVPPVVGDPVSALEALEPRTTRSGVQRALAKVLQWAVSLAVVLGAWVLFLWVFNINSFIGKTPLGVWRFLTSSEQASDARATLYHASITTLRDAFVGLAAGTAAALVCAIAFNLRRSVEQTFMPVAMVLWCGPMMVWTGSAYRVPSQRCH